MPKELALLPHGPRGARWEDREDGTSDGVRRLEDLVRLSMSSFFEHESLSFIFLSLTRGLECGMAALARAKRGAEAPSRERARTIVFVQFARTGNLFIVHTRAAARATARCDTAISQACPRTDVFPRGDMLFMGRQFQTPKTRVTFLFCTDPSK